MRINSLRISSNWGSEGLHEQLARRRVGIDLRLRQIAFVGKQLADCQVGRTEIDVVELEDLQFAIFDAELLKNLGDLLMLLGAGHGYQLVAVAIDCQVDADALPLEHVREHAFRRVPVDVLEVVKLEPIGRIEFCALFNLGNQFGDLLVLDR